jgi:hypothetical protein
MDNTPKRTVTPVKFTDHALARVMERAPGLMVDQDLARHIGVNYLTAATVSQQPIRGPAQFRVVELSCDTSVYAFCVKEDSGEIVVYTVLTADAVARSLTSGTWTVEPPPVLVDHNFIVSWFGGGESFHIQGCSNLNAVRSLAQKLVDAGVPENNIQVWSPDTNVRVRTHRIVTVEK